MIPISLGPAGKIDLHLLAEHHLCKRDVDIPRADDLLDRADALRTQRHRGNCLGAARTVDLGDPGNIEGDKRQGLDRRGEQAQISFTPATRAGTAHMRADEGYAARPPGT